VAHRVGGLTVFARSRRVAGERRKRAPNMGKGVLQRCCGRRSRAHLGVRVVGNSLRSFSEPLGPRAKGVVFLVVVVLGGALAVEGALAQSLTVDHKRFGSGQTVTVSGTGFPPGASVTVWFDSDGNGVLNGGETPVMAGVDARGAFSGAKVLAVASPGDYALRAGLNGTSPIASTGVTIDTCWVQSCTIDGAETVCILGNSPRDVPSDCKAVDSSYSDSPTGYDFSNTGPQFLGATTLAVATDDLGPAGTGCAAMSTAITAAESPPYFNQVPNKASLLAAACTSFPLSPTGFPLSLPVFVGLLTAAHPNDAAVKDAQVLLGLVEGAVAGTFVLPVPLPALQYLMAAAAVDGAIACGFVDYFCDGIDLTRNFIGNPTLQASLIPTLPGLPVLGLKRWGDIIGWAQVVCTGTMVPSCPAPTPGSAGPDNSLAQTRCVTGKVVGLSIGYDGDISFDVNDGFFTKTGELDRTMPGPNVRPFVNYHNFEEGFGGSDAPGGIDVEIPYAVRDTWRATLAGLRKDKSAVTVCGQFVTDMNRGWNELHPISVLLPAAFPLPPTGVTATAKTNGIHINWTVLPGVTYEVWRSVPKQHGTRAQPPRLIKATPRPPFDDTTAKPGVTYTYFVRAVYPAGRSEFSNAVSAKRP
jgi:hypothetical protein